MQRVRANGWKRIVFEIISVIVLALTILFDQLSKRTGENSNNILNDWLETAVINSEMISLIIELRKRYKIALLSNAPGEFLNRILKRIDTDKVFDFMIISSEEKIA